jgi:ABC-type Fe3+/spermidine/putrescine transport system ATPase subunit
VAYIQLKNVSKSYDGKNVLSNINLAVDKGRFVSLLGQSGCGKTTLLRIIAGLENAGSGSILLDGDEITDMPIQLRNISIVFQNYALFPHMNVFENIAYGLKVKKYSSLKIQDKVNEVLRKVNLLQKAKHNVSLLSGGEQQRVALARAIVTEPQIILLDEPLSNLDYSLRLQARSELKRLQNEIGITCIYVTHDQSEALALSDEISVMDNGCIVQTGTPEDIYHNPLDTFTAGFVGRYNIFNGVQSSNLFGRSLSDPHSVLAVLPEHLNIHKTPGNTDVTIKDILFTGILTEYVLSAGGQAFKAVRLANGCCDFKKGEYVSLSASEENVKTIHLSK